MRGRVAYGTPMADLTNAQIAAALRRARRPLRARRRGLLPGDRLPQRGQGGARVLRVDHGDDARGPRDRPCPGIGKTLEEKLRALDETGDIPAAREAARQVPARPDRGHAPAGLRAQARPPALRRARRSTRSTRCARPPRRARSAELRGFGAQGRGAAQADAGRPRGRRRAGAAGAALARDRRSPRRSSARCARTRRATASRWPARCAAAPTRSRTSTSSPPPATRRRSRARSASSSSWSPCSPSGDAGARVTTHTGMKIDLKVVEPDQFGNVLQHFTGSKAHNVALRESAVRRGLHVSEYGILDDETGRDAALRDRGGGLRAARAARGSRPSCARAAASWRRRAGGPALPRAGRRSRTSGRPAHAHDRLRRPQTAEEMALAARERGLRVHRDHRPLGLARLRQRRLARRARARGSTRSARSTSASRASSS